MKDIFRSIRLDFRAAEPINTQIVRQIEQLVREGVLKQGDQLPTVRELATELRINFSTVARAYKILDEERLISTQRGRGTFIWEEPPPGDTKMLRRGDLEALARNYLEDAARLGFRGDEAANTLWELLEGENGKQAKQNDDDKRLK